MNMDVTVMRSFIQWFDTAATQTNSIEDINRNRVDWLRVIPFILMHLACLAVFWVGVSWAAVSVATALYWLRMFAITAFYHRYFSHRAFKTSRTTQFAFALLGASATQRGPLWWAAHHREHHRKADTTADPHTPLKGFWWSHMGWFLSKAHFAMDPARVRDWAKFPELCWLDRFDLVVPVMLAGLMYGLGCLLHAMHPQWGTNGEQMLVWGYFISTVVLLHATLTINSLAHRWGKRRFNTEDDSRNNWLLAIMTLGEGWHNNHHFFPASARQGFYWWELDISYYLIQMMGRLGLVWDIKSLPHDKLAQGERS
jgi:stearoyl-CoA desaturase (delta-9 desaturase)